MEKKTKVKIAFADAVITSMWLKGLITAQERDQMQQKCDEKLRKTNCSFCMFFRFLAGRSDPFLVPLPLPQRRGKKIYAGSSPLKRRR